MINFRKLKSQVKPFKEEGKKGFIFLATDEQKDNWVWSVAIEGSRRRFTSAICDMINTDKDYKKEFYL